MRMGMGAPGLQGLLKEGYKHLQGLEEAILRNVEACKMLSTMTRTSLGPNGMFILPFFTVSGPER